eukprot:1159115-Pelagomonas_calceolata.AAC.6
MAQGTWRFATLKTLGQSFAEDSSLEMYCAQVRYKRLEKGTFVEFQPLSRGFHDAVGGDVKQHASIASLSKKAACRCICAALCATM